MTNLTNFPVFCLFQNLSSEICVDSTLKINYAPVKTSGGLILIFNLGQKDLITLFNIYSSSGIDTRG